MSGPGEKCKQRFKGVENFLRKVAFNLGNTPSQTEVKIISCIPIDVTDLQQKIISLEKELDAVKASKSEAAAKTVACCPSTTNALHVYCQPNTAQTARIEQCEGAYMKRSGSDDSTNTRAVSLRYSNQGCPCCSDSITISYGDNQQIEMETQCQLQRADKKGKLKNVLKKKGKNRTHLVYYAQTESGPFTSYQNQNRISDKAGTGVPDVSISSTYISEVIQKQYAAVPIVDEFPVCNQISSPVCRDVDSVPDQPIDKKHLDTDLCSCLHGPFQNIDIDHSTNRVHNPPLPACSYNSNSTDFYDTSLYDMVPVKEKSDKLATHEAAKRKSHIEQISSLSGNNRQNHRYHPFVVNYSRISPLPVVYPKNPQMKLVTKKDKRDKELCKREQVMRHLERNQECRKNCSIDCGDVYMKRIEGKVKRPINSIVSVTRKNAECLTNNVKDTECQTTTSQSVQIDNDFFQDDKKTEDTLNQIKVILQSVLTEVKTNTQEKKVAREKPTKDAIVQKGLSQGMVPGCSSMLNSYTYSPYNMNPYVPSWSRQTNSGAACYLNVPYAPGKYLHNFPVFIQTPMRDLCSCYRHNSKVAKDLMKPKFAATTATNTEAKERSEETQKLIQEIYKSVKLNMEMPMKDTSASENNGIVSTPRHSFNKSFDVGTVQEEGIKVFMKSNAEQKNPSKEMATTTLMNFNNKPTSNTMSLQSQMISTTDTEQYLRNNRVENYLKSLDAHNRNKIVEEYEAPQPSTSEGSSEEEKSDDDVASIKERVKKPAKRGLFSKMFKGSCKMFKRKPKKKEEEIQVENETEDDESEGESDDYQTVYSQKEIDQMQKHHVVFPVRIPVKGQRHSNVSFSRRIQERNQGRNRSPYMEQVYRRQWNEKLMLYGNQHRISAETPPSTQNDLRRANPTYNRDYQAMSAHVGHKLNRTGNAVVNPSVPMYTKNKGVTLRIPRKSGPRAATKGFTWLKKHKPACGEQWKRIILEG